MSKDRSASYPSLSPTHGRVQVAGTSCRFRFGRHWPVRSPWTQRDTKKRVSHRKTSCAVVSSGATDKGTFSAVVFYLRLASWLGVSDAASCPIVESQASLTIRRRATFVLGPSSRPPFCSPVMLFLAPITHITVYFGVSQQWERIFTPDQSVIQRGWLFSVGGPSLWFLGIERLHCTGFPSSTTKTI